MWNLLGSMVAFLTLTACGGSTGVTPDDSTETNVARAEAFVDAFYSFDAARLEAVLAGAEESLPIIVFYQGWAEGGHYQIVDRLPCEVRNPTLISCSVTVKDDLVGGFAEFAASDDSAESP